MKKSKTICRHQKIVDKSIQVGLLIPSLVYGGAERWTLDLVRFSDPAKIFWKGCVLLDGAWVDRGLLLRLSSLMPVYYDGNIWQNTVRQRAKLQNAVIELLGQSEVVLTWEINKRMRVILDTVCRSVVNVAHRDDVSSLSEFVSEKDHLASVWYSCRHTFSTEYTDRVKVIPNGIDINRCYPLYKRSHIRRNWGCKNSDIVVGYIGRLDPRKNCVALARAVATLNDSVGVIYGTRTNFAEGVEASMRAIAGDRLRFFPPVEDVGSVLGAIDVFIQPSYTEVFSLSLLEAWAAGVPVVATRVGAIPDLETLHGKLVVEMAPEADGNELATAIRHALSDRSSVIRMRQRAEGMVRVNYHILRMVNEWTQYLSQCVLEK